MDQNKENLTALPIFMPTAAISAGTAKQFDELVAEYHDPVEDKKNIERDGAEFKAFFRRNPEIVIYLKSENKTIADGVTELREDRRNEKNSTMIVDFATGALGTALWVSSPLVKVVAAATGVGLIAFSHKEQRTYRDINKGKSFLDKFNSLMSKLQTPNKHVAEKNMLIKARVAQPYLVPHSFVY